MPKSDYKANATAEQSEEQAKRRSTLRANPRRTFDPLKGGLEESYVKFFKPNRSMDARAKKRARGNDPGASKSEPAKKRTRLINDKGANKTETRVKIEDHSEEPTPRPAKATSKRKRKEVKVEMPAVKREEQSDDEANATADRFEVRTKRTEREGLRTSTRRTVDPPKEGVNKSATKNFQQNPSTDANMDPAAFKRSIPIERLTTQAADHAIDTQEKSNVTVLLVDSKTAGGGDRSRGPWLPAAKKNFLKSLGDVGREHLILDIDTTEYDLLDLFVFSDSAQLDIDEVVAPATEIVNQVQQLGYAYPLSKVVLIGWGPACLATLCALPKVSDKLACIVNIAFHESKFEKLDEGSMDIVSRCKVPMLFVVGGGKGDEGRCGEPNPVEFVNKLRAYLTVPIGIYIVEKASEELLVPAPMLRKSTTDQHLVNERIKYHVANFIKQALDQQRKTKRKAWNNAQRSGRWRRYAGCALSLSQQCLTTSHQ